MDDAMLDLMADRGALRRRLDAYADARLSPDLAATTRMRSRVLAVAHRQSALARSDATLALIADPIDVPVTSSRSRPVRRATRTALRRTAALVLAASLALAGMSAVALAAQPGGGLYDVRVWAETITLPRDPAERAVKEVDRLLARLAEIEAATASGNIGAAQAALAAYQTILLQATTNAIAADDDIAEAVLKEGVANNIEVLTGLIDKLPPTGSEAVGNALERAIERSNDAVESFEPDNGNDGGGGPGGSGGNGAGDPGGPDATRGPTATEAPDPTATPKPTREPKPTATPKATTPPKPTAPPKPDPTQRPERTPRPTPAQGGGGGGGGGNPGGDSTTRPGPPGQGD